MAIATAKAPGRPGLMGGPVPSLLAARLPGLMSTAIQQTATARTAAYEAAIQADPFDVAAWDARIAEAKNEGKAAPVFDRAVSRFPTSARIWISYAEWCEVQAQDVPLALSVFRRCLRQVPNLDLWVAHLTFCKRYQPLEEIFRAYQAATDVLGTDFRAGTMWAEYIGLLKKAYNLLEKKRNSDAEVSGRLLAEEANPIEASRRSIKPVLKKKIEDNKEAHDISDDEFIRVGELLQIDVNMVRTAFQRAVSSAHATLDKIWVGYEQFEKSLGNSPLASNYLGDFMPRYLRGKQAFKELQVVYLGVDHFSLAAPIRSQTAKHEQKKLEKWRGVLNYERTNPLRLPRVDLQARVSLVYQQVALCCSFHAEVWNDFSTWLDMGNQSSHATTCLRQAVERFLPKDLTLRLLIAHRLEITEMPATAESLKAADEEYQKILEDVPKPCPLALINYMSFIRRQRGAPEFRDAFLEAIDSSPHCTWEVYAFAAMVEYHVYDEIEAASRVFRLGLERYRDREPALLAAYVNFLVGVNDLKSARAELSRSVLDRLQGGVRDHLANRSDKMTLDSLSFLWQKWTRLERYFGDAGAVKRATSFRDDEYRNMQRDQEVEDEVVSETPVALGLSASIEEVEESFRFQHLIPRSVKANPETKPATPAPAEKKVEGAASSSASTAGAEATSAKPADLLDHTVSEAVDGFAKLGSDIYSASVHIARPDVSKMLAFRPALDVVGRKRPSTEVDPSMLQPPPPGQPPVGIGGGAPLGEEKNVLPTMIPKCLQDLLAVLPSRPLKGQKPDVDYLLTVLQTVTIPPVPIKDLAHFRYDSLRLDKEDDGRLMQMLAAKDDMEAGGSFFSSRTTSYRDRLSAKRQKVLAETNTKVET